MSQAVSFIQANSFEYTKSCLLEKIQILNDRRTSIEFLVHYKNHLSYLDQYLGSPSGLNAKFFLVEDNYVNRDYLLDYAHYYSYCFEDYKKKSSRIHFFTYKNANKSSFEDDLVKCFSPKII